MTCPAEWEPHMGSDFSAFCDLPKGHDGPHHAETGGARIEWDQE